MPNKAQFIELLAERLDGDRKKAQAALDAVIDTIYASIAKGEQVTLTGFGIFERRERQARLARNPATGASVKVKRRVVPVFRAGAEFKAITSGARKVAKAPARKAAGAAKRGSAAKSTSAAKAPAKKTTAKKTAASKAPAKKTAAKKTTASKTTAKKAPAKKAAAKKSTARKSSR